MTIYAADLRWAGSGHAPAKSGSNETGTGAFN
jgi:hypothetical protein